MSYLSYLSLSYLALFGQPFELFLCLTHACFFSLCAMWICMVSSPNTQHLSCSLFLHLSFSIFPSLADFAFLFPSSRYLCIPPCLRLLFLFPLPISLRLSASVCFPVACVNCAYFVAAVVAALQSPHAESNTEVVIHNLGALRSLAINHAANIKMLSQAESFAGRF